jgi:hypothetical protein
MSSPVPGLDPYLEPFWSNMHTRMMTYIADAVQSQLPPGLWTRVEEVVTVDGPESVIPVDEPITLRHLEIVDTRSGGALVTAIEVLSPANKVGRTRREHYQRKQADYLAAEVNLVEIDLIRAGEYIVSLPQVKLPHRAKRGGGLVSVYRASIAWPEWEIYAIDLRQRLPTFCIPLRRGDADVILDLQAILDQCYRNGGYHLGIDYTQRPEPNVAPEDQEWLEQFLRDKGFRS